MSKINIRSADLIDAKLEEHQMCGSNKQCPGCGHKFEGKPDWLGLPAGVKFDPTDQELIEHLEAKVEAKEDTTKSHPLIDEFIPTIEGEDGICYTHPEKLPGVTRDGLSRHFFHRPSKAYTTGTRKRRKIQTECDHLQAAGGETRWHKTGKTRPVMVNGKQKGCKKILVLYTNFGKNRKPEKTNWVMHQYHLGQHEEEKEGELVVSKIFYQTQPRQCNWSSEKTRAAGAASVSLNCGEGSSSDLRREHSGGSGSCTSSKEIIVSHNSTSTHVRDHRHQQHDQMSAAAVAAAQLIVNAAHQPLTSYNAMDIHQLKSDHFSFVPFRKSFDEIQRSYHDLLHQQPNTDVYGSMLLYKHGVGIGGEASTAREASIASGACEDQLRERPQLHHHDQLLHHHHLQQQHQHDHQSHQLQQHMATAASFHISRPSHPISNIISPSSSLHHSSATCINFDQDAYHASRSMMLQNEHFKQQHQQEQQQQHHKQMGGRSASGLDELIMACTSSSNVKEDSSSSMANRQEQEWMKYSSFWPDDPDNPDHHG